MSGPWCWLAACAALSSTFACANEVTVYLLSNGGGSRSGPTGTGGTSQADAGRDARADANDGPGEAGSEPDVPCQKLGPEVCNGGDDDCNGLTDEGCNYTVLWTRGPDSPILGHSTGGVTFLQPCPDGSALVGLHEGMGNWLNQISAICRQIVLHADMTQTPVSFSVTLGPRFDPPFVPATSVDTKNQVGELLCPDGLVLSGVDGTTTVDNAHYILGVRIICAPPIVTTQAGEPVLDSDRAQEKMAGPVVCVGCSATQAYNFVTTIPEGHVASGLFGGDGLWIDRVGFSASLGSIRIR